VAGFEFGLYEMKLINCVYFILIYTITWSKRNRSSM